MTLIRNRITAVLLLLTLILTAVPVGDVEAASIGGDLRQTANGITVNEAGHVHAPIRTPAKVGDCTTEGNIEFWFCPGCAGFFLDEACTQEVLPGAVSTGYVHQQMYYFEPEDATCTEDGTAGFWICTNCHSCFLDEGYTQPTTIEERKISKLNHASKVKTDEQPSTCTEQGNYDYWYCSLCQKYFLDEDCTQAVTFDQTKKPLLSHVTTPTAAKQATCTEGGNIAYWYCETCETYYKDEACTMSVSYEDTQIGATGHSAQLQPAVAAGCTEAGSEACYYCSNCKGYFSDAECLDPVDPDTLVIAPNGHSAEEQIASAPHCAVPGNVHHWYCPNCKGHFADADCEIPLPVENWQIKAPGHELKKTEEKKSSCIEAGNPEYWYCKECGKYYLDEACSIEASEADLVTTGGHDPEHFEAIDPACATAGNIEYWHCSLCGKYFSDAEASTVINESDTVLRALGHTAEYVPASSPDCTTDGNEGAWYCEGCKSYYWDQACENPMPLNTFVRVHLGHDEETKKGYARTCTKSGLTDGVWCRRCETWVVPQQEIPAEGHKPVSVPGYGSTYTSKGLTDGSECSVCHETLTARKEIPMLTIAVPAIQSLTRGISGITISWNPSEVADCYQVLRGISSNTSNMKVLDTITGTTYVDTTAKTGTKYYYRLRACVSESGEVVNRSAASGYRALVVVKAPKTIKVTPAANGLTVTFTKVTNAEDYVIQYRTDSKAWTTLDVTCTTSGSYSLRFTHTGLTTGTTYLYRIKALQVVDNCRHFSSFVTSEATTMVAAPASVKSTIQNKGIKVSWAAVKGATGYILQKKVGTGSWKTLKTITDGNTAEYLCTGLVSGQKYAFRVYAYKDSTDVKSAVSSVVTRYYLSRPTISSAESKTAKKMTLKWTRDPNTTGYEIRYAYSASFPSKSTKTVLYTGAVATVTKTLSGLTSKKVCYVQIRSYKTVDGKKYYSAWSKTQQATVK